MEETAKGLIKDIRGQLEKLVNTTGVYEEIADTADPDMLQDLIYIREQIRLIGIVVDMKISCM